MLSWCFQARAYHPVVSRHDSYTCGACCHGVSGHGACYSVVCIHDACYHDLCKHGAFRHHSLFY